MSVVAIVLELDGLAAGLLVAFVLKASLHCCALLANDDILEVVINLLFGLQGVETLAHLTADVFKLMKQVSVVHVTRLHHCLGQVFVRVDDHTEFDKFSLMHWQDIFYGHRLDSLDWATPVIDLLGAHLDFFGLLKSVLDLFDSQITLLKLVCEDHDVTSSFSLRGSSCFLVFNREGCFRVLLNETGRQLLLLTQVEVWQRVLARQNELVSRREKLLAKV